MKTVLALTAIVFGLAFQGGRLQYDYLTHLSAEACFMVGLFTVLAGVFLQWAFLLHYRPTSSGGKLSSHAIRFLCFPLGFFTAVLCFDSHSMALMQEAPQKWLSGSYGCSSVQKKEPKAKAPQQGCELVYRAYELGLIKSLSACGKTEEDENMGMCTLRQDDEPLLHYSARRFADAVAGLRGGLDHGRYFGKVSASLRQRLQRLGQLFARVDHVVNSVPRASHHIFTNLPYPEGSFAEHWHSLFDKDACLSRYRKLPYTFDVSPNDPSGESKILDHVYGQMLFNPKHGEMAGVCKEYAIHWNSPRDACQRLAQNPEGFLRSMGTLDDIRQVFARLEEQVNLKMLQVRLTSIATGLPPPLPPPPSVLPPGGKKPRAFPFAETVMSFQCLMQTEKGEKASIGDMGFQLYGHTFRAHEVRFIGQPDSNQIHVDMYKELAHALTADFRYETMSNASVSPSEITVAGEDFMMTRMEYLKHTDVFLGNDWLQKNEDLLEIYPYYYHLNHFIDSFRQEYRSERTRL